MSLPVRAIPPVPEETMRVAHAAFPKGSRYMQIRDILGTIYTDADFAALYPTRGRPAVAPWQLALVTVLQFAEGLSDRQAADAVRSRIDWKYALGLDLTDAGFDASVLCEFRQRLVSGAAEQVLLDRLLAACRAQGLLAARGHQRTDATHVVGALRVLSRLELVAETWRVALEAVAVADGDWLRRWAPSGWYQPAGRWSEAGRLPRSKADRLHMAEAIGADGVLLLTALEQPETPQALRGLTAVTTLRQVWEQHYTITDQAVHFRPQPELPPPRELIQTPHDPEARYARRSQLTWVGYKVHLTETCDDARPHLLTQITTTPAPVADVEQVGPIQAALAQRDLLPQTHLVDAGYVRSSELVRSQEQYGIALLGPALPDAQWQAQADDGFAARDFQIDWAAQRATCPQGRVSQGWRHATTPHGPRIVVRFASADCQACPVRARCTRAHGGRQVSLPLQPQAEALHAARHSQDTTAVARRAGIEGTISQGVRAFGLRHARYRGLAKTHVQHVATATAMNLFRLSDWFSGVPRARTRPSPLTRLSAA